MISGEAGIGKTALVDALAREAEDLGAQVLAGHCYDRTETPPYGPWIQIAAGAAPLGQLEEIANQADLFAQTRDFLADLATRRPLLLVLEDLHWADIATLDLLRYIARGLAHMPLLLVVTYRGEDVQRHHPLAALVPLLVREASTERLNVRALGASAVQELVRTRYHLAERAAGRLTEFLMERSEGNALYLTELLRSLEEERLLDQVDEPSYAEVLAQAPVPTLLQLIVDDRLVRLGDETAALLAVAAVVGQEVSIAVWMAVAQVDEETVHAIAERAETAHLVAVWPNGQGIRFTHALIRDALVEHIPAIRRRTLHRKVGESLAALPLAEPDAVAYHFQEAGDQRAAIWLVRAGERAEDAYSLVTAAKRYEAAMEVLDAQEGDPAERAWVRLLAAAHSRHQDLNQARVWAEEAVQMAAIAEDPILEARAQGVLGMLGLYRGEYRIAVEALAAAADKIENSPSGTSSGRRELQIDRFVNRGSLISGLAYGGRFIEAVTQGETYLARMPGPRSWRNGLARSPTFTMASALPMRILGSRSWPGGHTPLRSPRTALAAITLRRSGT